MAAAQKDDGLTSKRTSSMGIEYSQLILPSPRLAVPSPAQLAQFSSSLRREGWLNSGSDPGGKQDPPSLRATNVSGSVPEFLSSDWFSDLVKGEFCVLWPVWNPAEAGGKDVFQGFSRRTRSFGYNIELHFSDRFLYPRLACVEDLKHIDCPCGVAMVSEAEPFEPLAETRRIALQCRSCGRPFDPDQEVVHHENPWTGQRTLLRGGGCYRFCVEIACGPFHPKSGFAGRVAPDFLKLCESGLGCQMIEVSDAS